jgi:hypothetical protein
MNDPHVDSLRYNLVCSAHVRFNNPPPVEWDCDEFHLKLSDGILSATMKEHYPTEESARAAIEPFLRAWEIEAGLARNRPSFTFEFADSVTIDRSPPQSNAGNITVMALSGTVKITGHAVFVVTSGKYPQPPFGFKATEEVQRLWQRYSGYIEGKEPILSMAYFCLTVLERTTGVKNGARKLVCSKYNIEQAVRDKLGDLTSAKGGPDEARKFDFEASGDPLTGPERHWVESVVKALIRRKAEFDADPTLAFPKITMNDFPPLSS